MPFRPAFLSLVLLAGLAAPAIAGPAASGGLAGLARREGLLVTSVSAAGRDRLVVRCAGALSRDVFLKRASLVAYAAFKGKGAPRELVFEHSDGKGRQRCRIAAPDLEAYLSDAITKHEYWRRLDYRASVAAAPRKIVPALQALRPPAPPALPQRPEPASLGVDVPTGLPGVIAVRPPLPSLPAARPPLPPLPDANPAAEPPLAAPPAVPVPRQPLDVSAAPSPVAAAGPLSPAAATFSGTWSFGWALGFGRGSYDAYRLAFSHTLLPTLELRPALWIVSAFSPLNRMAGAGQGLEGLSAAIDMVGSTRRQVGPAGVAVEGGLGVRGTSLQGPVGAGFWPAMHLCVGARWQALGLTMRYPLLGRPGDPTGTWEGSLGLTWNFGADGNW